MSEISQKQDESGEEKAKKGGPKTPEGKAVSKYNALKYGLSSKEVLLKGEKTARFVQFRKNLQNELGPKTALEGVQADRIIWGEWRLKRLRRFERDVLESVQSKVNPAPRDAYDTVVRYEVSIQHGIQNARNELERLQEKRRAEEERIAREAYDAAHPEESWNNF